MTKHDKTLPARLEAARQRSEDLAADASSRARTFVHDHPLATVAGGIVLGALIAGVVTGRKRRKAGPAATARLTRLATLGAELALAYATRAVAVGKEGASQIGETGAEAAHKVTDLGEVALTTLRQAINRLTNHD